MPKASQCLKSFDCFISECKLSIPKPRTNYCKWSFSYIEAVSWKSLPKEIKQSNSLNDFKLKLKITHFPERYYLPLSFIYTTSLLSRFIDFITSSWPLVSVFYPLRMYLNGNTFFFNLITPSCMATLFTYLMFLSHRVKICLQSPVLFQSHFSPSCHFSQFIVSGI